MGKVFGSATQRILLRRCVDQRKSLPVAHTSKERVQLMTLTVQTQTTLYPSERYCCEHRLVQDHRGWRSQNELLVWHRCMCNFISHKVFKHSKTRGWLSQEQNPHHTLDTTCFTSYCGHHIKTQGTTNLTCTQEYKIQRPILRDRNGILGVEACRPGLVERLDSVVSRSQKSLLTHSKA